MTDKEKMVLLNKLIDLHERIDGFHQSFDSLFGVGHGFAGASDGLFAVFNDLFDEFRTIVAEKIGDSVEGIDWFIYDNQCGKKGLECRHSESEEPFYIKNAEDYVNFLNFCNKNN